MDEADIELRNVTYRLFASLGRAPTVDEVAVDAGAPAEEVAAGWRRLHDAHALVLDPDRTALRMAHPFSAVPTPFRVHAAGRDWFANCAWDAFGICAALGVDGRIDTRCPDCDDPIVVEVVDGRPSASGKGPRPHQQDESLVFHCLVPAARWWDDIAYT